jgi:DNA-directed RNA polymerase specialized sigma24 family protein
MERRIHKSVLFKNPETMSIVMFDTISLECLIEAKGEFEDTTSVDLPDLVNDRMTCDQILLLLNDRQREIMLLKIVGYETYREIGAIMGLADSTIEKEVRKIKERVRNFQKKVI